MKNKKEEEIRINDKIEKIQKYLEELEKTFPVSFEEYKDDFKIKAIWERYFSKIIEVTVDVAFLIIKRNGLKIPDDDESSFFILSEKRIIGEDLAKKLRAAKGMRNIIVHEYGEIDDILVYQAVEEKLFPDIEEFIDSINIFLNNDNVESS